MKHVITGHFHFITTKMDGWSFVIHSMSVALENIGNANMSNITVNCYVGNPFSTTVSYTTKKAYNDVMWGKGKGDTNNENNVTGKSFPIITYNQILTS